jgi:acetyl esterase/lipase
LEYERESHRIKAAFERTWILTLSLLLIAFIGYSQENTNPEINKPEPTHKEVSYGENALNVLDFWQVKSDRKAPLVVFIHGGGFQALSKEKLSPKVLIELLDAGISVAAINYRLAPAHPLPAAFEDSKIALQFLRSKSEEWNIDKSKIGAFGGSAGAMISMWLAFHNDMKEDGSADIVLQQSTSLCCVATMGGQITFDRKWMEISIPGGFIHKNPAFLRIFGVESFEELDNEPEIKALIHELSPITHLSPDDPPVYMEYYMALDSLIPEEKPQRKPWALHHVIFGYTLKARMKALNIESDLNCPGEQSIYQSVPEFFISKLSD